MSNKTLFIPPRPQRERTGVDTRQYMTPDEWVRAAGSDNDYGDDPGGTMRLAVHLNTSHQAEPARTAAALERLWSEAEANRPKEP